MKFSQDICIPCYHTDAKGLLKPAAFMDLAQEVAYWAATDLGFGYDNLHVHHTAWVLTRMHIHFGQPLVWRDNVTLFTWHKGANGLFFLRDFDLRDSAGNSRITATSSWAPRLVPPKSDAMEPSMTHVVSYSDLDINAHTNNARYVVWAMDCLPQEAVQTPVKDLYINFIKETVLGDNVQLFTLHEGNAWTVEGRVDDKTCFLV